MVPPSGVVQRVADEGEIPPECRLPLSALALDGPPAPFRRSRINWKQFASPSMVVGIGDRAIGPVDSICRNGWRAPNFIVVIAAPRTMAVLPDEHDRGDMPLPVTWVAGMGRSWPGHARWCCSAVRRGETPAPRPASRRIGLESRWRAARKQKRTGSRTLMRRGVASSCLAQVVVLTLTNEARCCRVKRPPPATLPFRH